MRLIDADTLCVHIEEEFDGVCVYDVSGNEAAREFCDMVDIAPTIDAIPVEWLQDMARRTEAQAEPHFAFMYVLHEWQDSKPIEVQQAESEMRDWQKEQEENGE